MTQLESDEALVNKLTKDELNLQAQRIEIKDKIQQCQQEALHTERSIPVKELERLVNELYTVRMILSVYKLLIKARG